MACQVCAPCHPWPNRRIPSASQAHYLCALAFVPLKGIPIGQPPRRGPLENQPAHHWVPRWGNICVHGRFQIISQCGRDGSK
eukprot:438339-Amphidinium_carterae.2